VSPGARAIYLASTAGMVVVGVGATAALGGPVRAAVLGGCLAWALQAGALWLLLAGLGRRERVTGRWAIGLAIRVAGIGAVAALAPAFGIDRGAAVVAYGGAIVAFLLAEAAWLWWASSRVA
jgi:hypothetical protein